MTFVICVFSSKLGTNNIENIKFWNLFKQNKKERGDMEKFVFPFCKETKNKFSII
jgi:hypothetical protein